MAIELTTASQSTLSAIRSTLGFFLSSTPVKITPNNNVFLGSTAGNNTTTGSNNNFFGRYAGYSNTTGSGYR